ncbi:methyltransferase domain-containing protein [Leptothermofonsia sp. ETS-13]|uniref:methyltransferase domain-containing protein n=1 Tax=Leptothermofonsia sp. ETS-13 TaxID=3035696 RepID=UPI003BA1ED55
MWKTVSFGILSVASLGVILPGIWVSLPGNAQLTPPPSPEVSPSPVKPDSSSPMSERVVTSLLKLAEVSQDDVLYILGSGDGQLAIAAAQTYKPKRIVVIDPNSELIQQSQANAQEAGFGDRIQFLQQEPLQSNLREATVVAISLPTEKGQQIRSKLLADLKPGTRIVSHGMPMGDWKPDKSISVSRSSQQNLYHWIVPANIEGDWQGSLEYAPGRRHPYTLRFSQQFQKVKGDVIVDGQKYNIPKIALTGDRLTFSRTENIQGQTMTAVFNGRVQGNTLKGIAELDAGILSRKFPVIAKRSTRQAAQ